MTIGKQVPGNFQVFTPYTLHPTPYFLYPIPYTQHPAPNTLHPTPNTLHPTPYTLHPTPDRQADPRQLPGLMLLSEEGTT
jgi:hypothetical protein